MTSADDAPSTNGTNLLGKKTLTKRLGTLFSTKPTHISDHYIELDEPYRLYGPGDAVKGQVALKVARPLGVTHVVVSLSGFVSVSKQHSALKVPARLSNERAGKRGRRWASEYYGDGFASLFEDEVVLCGEGRLDPQFYKFRFEIDFPTTLKLPSSIDFERGTICYIISSTVTRPLAINPQRSCQRKVNFRDSIDVGLLSKRKQMVASLKPVNKGAITNLVPRLSETHLSKRRSVTSSSSRMIQPVGSLNDRISLGESQVTPPLSPSVVSTTSDSSSRAKENSSRRNSQITRTSNSAKNSSEPALVAPSRIITATVEIPKAGCLPGEVVPVLVRVQHVKPIKSLNGIVVTLYRQARVDMHPDLPLGPSKGRNGRTQYEDYYPRSRSGLGGLSLSAAGSSQVWRKNLSQTVAPLYVNPVSLSAEVRLAVHVPAEAFSTIQNTPGDMISFSYHIEVIIDIHGKLAAYDRGMTTVTAGKSYTDGNGTSFGSDEQRTVWGLNCVDTSSMRRARSAVTIGPAELIIGTRDSTKVSSKGKGKLRERDDEAVAGRQEQAMTNGHTIHGTHQVNENIHHDSAYEEEYYGYSHDGAYNGFGYDDEYYDNSAYDYDHDQQWQQFESQPAYEQVPIPHLPDETNLTEKERLKRAEEALLPSQPPGTEDSSMQNLAPTAPYLPNEADFDSPNAYREAVHRQDFASPSLQPSRATHTNIARDVVEQPSLARPAHSDTTITFASAEGSIRDHTESQSTTPPQTHAQLNASPTDSETTPTASTRQITSVSAISQAPIDQEDLSSNIAAIASSSSAGDDAHHTPILDTLPQYER